MRVLLFTGEFPPTVGGIGKYCSHLALGLANLGHDVIVLTPARAHRAGREHVGGYTVVRYQFPLSGRMKYVFSAWALLRASLLFRPERVLITHTHVLRLYERLINIFSLSFCTILYGADIVQHARSPAWHAGFQRLCSEADCIICISNYTRRLLEEKFSVPAGIVEIVYPIVDTNSFECEPGSGLEIREQLSLTNSRVILTISRLTPRKGHDQLIEALPMVKQEIANVKYVIGGTGPDLQRLRGIAEQNGVEQDVLFVGYVPEDELPAYYDMCDVFAMVSREQDDVVEGFGIVFLEAALCGKPVIAGDHGGVPEAVEGGVTGFLVDPLDVDEIADRVIQVLQNQRLAKKLGQNGKRRVLDRFTVQAMAEQMDEVLRRTGRGLSE